VLDPEQFQRCFVAWVAAVSGHPEGVIAIDGKTVRRSGRKQKGQERRVGPGIFTPSRSQNRT
jgi:hypothetical protein